MKLYQYVAAYTAELSNEIEELNEKVEKLQERIKELEVYENHFDVEMRLRNADT